MGYERIFARSTDYESRGQEIESSRAHHILKVDNKLQIFLLGYY